jgi:hypothetical protein
MPAQELFKIVGSRVRLPSNMPIRIHQSTGDQIVYRLAWKLAKSPSQVPEAKQCVSANEWVGYLGGRERNFERRCQSGRVQGESD